MPKAYYRPWDNEEMAELNELTERMLRKDPAAAKKAQSARVKEFLDSRGAERKAKLGESTGLGDLLTFMPGMSAAKALKAGKGAEAAVNALAFTSQFDDSKGGQAVGDALAFFPVFGMGSTKGLERATKRLRNNPSAELPFLKGEGKMAPARFRQFEKGIKSYITDMSGADPDKNLKLLDDWLSTFSKTKPIDKNKLFDRMPAALRPGLYQAAKEMGYGGIALGQRSKAPMDKVGRRETKAQHLAKYGGDQVTGGRMNPTQIAPAGPRKWEEIMQAEQKGYVPEKWAEAFKQKQAKDLDPKTKAYLEAMGVSSAVGAASNALGPQRAESGDQKAGLVVNKRNIGRLAKMQEEQWKRLNAARPGQDSLNELESIFAAKYPKIYEKSVADSGGKFGLVNGISGGGTFSPTTGKVSVNAPEKEMHWKNYPYLVPEVLDSMGHEATHALDFKRLGKVNDLETGRKLDVNDFISPNIKHNKKEIYTLSDRMQEQNIPLPDKFDPRYITPAAAEGKHHDLDIARFIYESQPIEKRAFKAGATSRKSTTKLLEMLSDDL